MKKLVTIALMLTLCLTILSGCGTAAPAETPNPDGEKAPQWKVLPEALATEEYAIGFRKNDAALANLVNKTLCELKNDGTLAAISAEWFGKDITTIPATVESQEVADDDKSAERTKLILGLDASFPPMGYTDNNIIVGFDIDVAKAVCEKLNWELELQPIEWDAKQMELDSGNIDCIWNGMTRNAEREEAMSLSLSYMNNEQVIVVLESSGITSLAGLAGKKLILQTGSSAEDALNGNAEFKETLGEVNTIADNMTAFMDVEQGTSDAILLDSIVADWYISNN